MTKAYNKRWEQKIASFNIGDLVVHKRQGYRAVVIDADPLFQASGRYNPQAATRQFSNRMPWYRLLVDGSTQVTYVEEYLLQLDSCLSAIDNPQVACFLTHQNGHYRANMSRH